MSAEQTPEPNRAQPDRPRIALISSSFAPDVGGVEEAVRNLAIGLAAQGHHVEVWTVDRAGGSSVSAVDGITVRYLPTPLPARSFGALVRFARAAPAAWRAWAASLHGFRPDLLHVHCFGPNGLYALRLSRRFGIPLLVTSHGETIADDRGVFGRSALLRRGLRRALSRAAAVTAPSGVVLEDLKAHYGLVTGAVIPNGVDLSVTATADASVQPYLFAAGRLGFMKGFDLLLQALAQADLDPSIRLVIGGDGPERERLEALATSLGVKSRVDLRGWMDPQAVADAMAGALAVVVPSRMEAFGIVALEAWRSAAPLIMTDRGGARSFVRDGEDGILVDPEDAPAFAAALRRVLEDPALRAALSAAGRSRVQAFGWEQVVAQYKRLYADVRAQVGRAA